MKNLILGSALGLLVALAAIFLYEKYTSKHGQTNETKNSKFHTIIGISGTVMEGATNVKDVTVKSVDAGISGGTTLGTPFTTKADGKYTTVTSLNTKVSATLTYATNPKNNALYAFLDFPAGNTIDFKDYFDFSKTPTGGVDNNRFEITLTGTSDYYAVRLIDNNGTNPQIRSNHNAKKGTMFPFNVGKETTAFTLDIYQIRPDGKLGVLTSYSFYIDKLPKEAVIYVQVKNLP